MRASKGRVANSETWHHRQGNVPMDPGHKSRPAIGLDEAAKTGLGPVQNQKSQPYLRRGPAWSIRSSHWTYTFQRKGLDKSPGAGLSSEWHFPAPRHA